MNVGFIDTCPNVLISYTIKSRRICRRSSENHPTKYNQILDRETGTALAEGRAAPCLSGLIQFVTSESNAQNAGSLALRPMAVGRHDECVVG
jgi:hypothetical protein